jgi:hypothetical protein
MVLLDQVVKAGLQLLLEHQDQVAQAHLQV